MPSNDRLKPLITITNNYITMESPLLFSISLIFECNRCSLPLNQAICLPFSLSSLSLYFFSSSRIQARRWRRGHTGGSAESREQMGQRAGAHLATPDDDMFTFIQVPKASSERTLNASLVQRYCTLHIPHVPRERYQGRGCRAYRTCRARGRRAWRTCSASLCRMY